MTTGDVSIENEINVSPLVLPRVSWHLMKWPKLAPSDKLVALKECVVELSPVVKAVIKLKSILDCVEYLQVAFSSVVMDTSVLVVPAERVVFGKPLESIGVLPLNVIVCVKSLVVLLP